MGDLVGRGAYRVARLVRVSTELLLGEIRTRLGFLGELANLDASREESFVCSMSNCDAAHRAAWGRIQQAAEDHYDRSADCTACCASANTM